MAAALALRGRQAAALGAALAPAEGACPEPGRGGGVRESKRNGVTGGQNAALSAGGSDGRKQEVVGRPGQLLGTVSERDLPLPCAAQPKVR